MGGAGVLLVRRTIGDVAVDDDEGRPVVGVLERVERPAQHFQVVSVTHPGDVPAIADKTGGHVITKSPLRVALDGDLVVVVDPAQIGKFKMAGQRRRLVTHPLHHAAVAAERVGVVVEHFEAGAIEIFDHPFSGDGHADTSGHTLPERSGGRLDARGPAVLGVTRTFAVELPESFDVVEGHRQLAQGLVLWIDSLDRAQMQHRIKKH